MGLPVRKHTEGETFLEKFYQNIHAACWASLTAFLLYFAVVIAPQIPEIQARVERLRIQETASEHELYCGKLGMGLGTSRHNECVVLLQEFRMKAERRLADEINDF